MNLKTVKSLNSEAPSILSTTFLDGTKDLGKLYVPKGVLEVYKSAEGWREFKNIQEIGTGVDDVTVEGISVAADGGKIRISGATDEAVVDVYGIGGQLVYRGTDRTIAVPTAGVYVVKVSGKVVKIIIK